MTYKYVLPIVMGACSGLLLPAKVAPVEPQCIIPPEELMVDGLPMYLAVCKDGDAAKCCAYGFMPNHQQLCFHVLCQDINDCTSDWMYIKAVCPPPETEATWEGLKNQYLLNENP